MNFAAKAIVYAHVLQRNFQARHTRRESRVRFDFCAGNRPARAPAWVRRAAWLCVGIAIWFATDALAQDVAALRAPDTVLITRPGLVLRLALEAQSHHDQARMRALLQLLATHHPQIADYADLLYARNLVAMKEWPAAQEFLAAAATRHASSVLHFRFYELLAEVHQKVSDAGAARNAWLLALAAAPPDEAIRAALLLHVAQAFEATGEEASALQAYRDLWLQYPTQPEAKPAGERLKFFEKKLGSLRTAQDDLRHADNLYAQGWSGDALGSYETALAKGLADTEKSRAERQRAHCLFQVRRYPEALAAFAQWRASDESSELWYTRALARSGAVEEAMRGFEELSTRASSAAIRLEAHYLVGTLYEGRAFVAEAARHYQAVAEAKEDSKYRADARWKLGWMAYRAGQGTEARQHFARLAAIAPSPTEKLQARYWTARSMEAENNFWEAQRIFIEIVREAPFSYYGWRASERIKKTARVALAKPRPLSVGAAALPAPQLDRIRILLEAGLEEDLRFELARLKREARGLEDRLRLASFYSDIGDYHSAQKIVLESYEHPLRYGVQPGQEEAWWFAWPQAYAEFVDDSLPERAKIDNSLVYAIMREESGYRPRVVSSAGARGLLQIMPETGARLAQKTGHKKFTADDLFRPEVNIALGAFYLNELTLRFQGRASAAIGSYNAGPEAVATWIKDYAGADDDEWVELIPYAQTQGYVKRVLRSLHVYRTLY